jgi:predicted site-specific integrase-resolvase
MDTENYISPNKITKQYDITSGTLRRWSEAGKIRCIRPNGGKRIYNIEDIRKIFNSEKDQKNEEMEQETTNKEKIPKKDKNDFNQMVTSLKSKIDNIDSKDSLEKVKDELSALLERFNSFN